MIETRVRAVMLLAVFTMAVVMAGCDGPAQVVNGTSPDARLNPKLTTHQKEILIKRGRDKGD